MTPIEPVWAAPLWFVAGVFARAVFDEWWQNRHRHQHAHHRKRRRGGR